jgi:PAS domain S-box-containing protein
MAQPPHAERTVRSVRDAVEVTVRERTATLRRTNAALQAEITARTRAEAALRASEARWRAIVAHAAVGMALGASNGRPLAANPALQHLLGDTADARLTRSWPALTHEDALRPTHAAMAALVDGTRPQDDRQKRDRRTDGRVIWVHASGSVVPGSDRRPRFLVELRADRTDRKRAEDSWRQAPAARAQVTRLTTLGALAASIAHEVTQPLAVVLTNGHAALRWLAAPTPHVAAARAAGQRIIRDGQRAGEVLQRVRARLTKTGPQNAWLDLNDVIQEGLTRAHSAVRRQRGALRTELAAGLPPVRGDRLQWPQGLLNLVMNGLDAMRAVADRSRGLLIRSGPPAPQRLVVAVRAASIGLDAPTVARIFDAFLTTTPEGMGLGLSISRTILAAHGGRVWATPHDGPGATVQLPLPMHGARAS